MDRKLVLVSGYYGFDNLGDEAILEELISELKRLVSADDIMILSANPERTASLYGVRAMQRKDFGTLWTMLSQARLFVSGGGGLFQNTRTVGSIMFYGLQILMAKAHQTPVLIYAQGIGPLNGPLAQNLTKQVFAQADKICVRDDASMKILADWGINGTRSSDPVWNLEPQAPPDAVLRQIENIPAKTLVGLSLRPSPALTDEHLAKLVDGLLAILSNDAVLVLLPLQEEQDLPVLQTFDRLWAEKGRRSILIDPKLIERPSQWAGLFSRFSFVVAMRLHALILALKAKIPVAGIAYDPKVTQLLAEFEQCCLILTKENRGTDWPDSLKSFEQGLKSHAKLVGGKLESAKKLSCQNFDLLAMMLNMPRESEN